MERYTRIFSLPTNLYAEGSLVILEAGALLKDNANNSMLAQLKFKNVNPKAIKMLKVEILPKDSMGRILEPATAYQYLDLHVCRNDSFGPQQAIELPDNSVRSFDVKVLEIGLEDNSIVKGSEAKWEALPNPTKLDDSELSKQCQIAYGNDFRYEAAEYSDLWYCACGALNRKNEEVCYKCDRPFKRISESDIRELTDAMEQRLAEEKRQREIEEEKHRAEAAEAEQVRKIREAEASAKKKKTFTILAFSGITIAVAIVVFLVVTNIVIPNQKYKSAITLMDAGQYEEAFSAFSSLSDYKGSKDLSIECSYQIGVTRFEDGDYEEALCTFNSLSDYKDSEALLIECSYHIGVTRFEEGNYSEALTYFDNSTDFSDANTYRTVLHGVSYFNQEDYSEAYRCFRALPDSFVQKYSDFCNYWLDESAMKFFSEEAIMSIDDAIRFLKAHPKVEELGPFSLSMLNRLKDCSGRYEAKFGLYQKLKIDYKIEQGTLVAYIDYKNFSGGFPNPASVIIPENADEKITIYKSYSYDVFGTKHNSIIYFYVNEEEAVASFNGKQEYTMAKSQNQ